MQRGRKLYRTDSSGSSVPPSECDALLGRSGESSRSTYNATTTVLDSSNVSDAYSDNISTELIDLLEAEDDNWWWWPWPTGLVLENTQSVARDHLASERTFLAYVRTSLAVVSAGVALSQLLIVQMRTFPQVSLGPFASAISTACVALGLTILFQGSTRYFQVQSALINGKFPVVRFGPTAISIALALLVTSTFIALFIYQKDMVMS